MKFDFSKSIIKNIYNLSESVNAYNEDTPINVEKSDWQILDTHKGAFLQKKYNFGNYKHMLYFISEVIKETGSIKKNPDMVISGLNIDVRIYSEFISDITSVELSISKFVDEIYEDIRYI